MNHTIRRMAAAAAGAGALVIATAGLAHADEDQAAAPAHSPKGTGSGLVGGPSDVYVLKGLAPLPVADPTLGLGTVLPPVFNAVGGLG